MIMYETFALDQLSLPKYFIILVLWKKFCALSMSYTDKGLIILCSLHVFHIDFGGKYQENVKETKSHFKISLIFFKK